MLNDRVLSRDELRWNSKDKKEGKETKNYIHMYCTHFSLTTFIFCAGVSLNIHSFIPYPLTMMLVQQ